MALSVFSDDSKPVDWWFLYKLPNNTAPKKGAPKGLQKTTGVECLYHDCNSSAPLAMSKHTLDHKGGALQATMVQIYTATKASADSFGWICYNDEIPGTDDNNGEKGHTKGVIAFDLKSDTAFWLLHSWPKFVDPTNGEPAAWNYGQTYLCITLKDVDTARAIANTMSQQQEPQTYMNRIPSAMATDDPLARLASFVDVNEADPPGDLTFYSKGGEKFRLLAKNRHWAEDFWIDLIGPKLGVNIEVETWRRGTLPGTEDSDDKHHVVDALYIDLEPLGIHYEWHYTKDHSKWGASDAENWVCVADINRQTSQEKRGGGAICFQNKVLWDSLRQIEKIAE